MHVAAKKMAVSGLLAAFAVVLILLGSVVESSTLFFLAAASFSVGIILREWGVLYGSAFLAAATLSGLVISPNKLYCLTFAAMGLYLVLTEIAWKKIGDSGKIKRRTPALWACKYIVFNVMYIPALYFFPSLLIAKKIEGVFLIFVLFAGQAALFVYDKAHTYFQSMVWGKIRSRLL